MKRGYMDWNKELLPPTALEKRRQALLEEASRLGADAVVVYGDVYSADELSYYVNYAPYWCNSAAVVTADEIYMVTGHNNRVNPWIHTLTGLEEDKLLASGFKVPARIAESLKERFPGGCRVGLVGKYVMADVVSQLENHGFQPVMMPDEAFPFAQAEDEAYQNTAAKAAAILKAAFKRGEEEYAKGGNSKETAAEIEYEARKNGAMDVMLYVSHRGLEFGLPTAQNDAGGRWVIYGMMQYLGVWVSCAAAFGCDTAELRRQMDSATGRLTPGAVEKIKETRGAKGTGEAGAAVETEAALSGCEIAVKQVMSDGISNLNPELKKLRRGQVIAVSAYRKSDGAYCEDMYLVMDEGAVVL